MFTRLSPRSSLFSSLIRSLAFCHYAHNCVECKVFIVLNTYTLCAVCSVFLFVREFLFFACYYFKPCTFAELLKP